MKPKVNMTKNSIRKNRKKRHLVSEAVSKIATQKEYLELEEPFLDCP